jgi:lysozyme
MDDNAPLLAVALPQIKAEEGCRLVAYLDTRGIPTIGWGRADTGVHLGMTCTQADADQWLSDHVAGVCSALDSALSWWRGLDLPRQAVLLSMAYQMGVEGLSKFTGTLSAVRAGKWVAASTEMLDSAWAKQTPNRAQRLAHQMLTGQI